MKNAEEILKDKNRSILAVSQDTTVFTAVKMMVENKVGAILVMKDADIVGMWTERDLMRNVLLPDFEPKTSLIGTLMMEGVDIVPHNISVNELFNEFILRQKRHLLVKKHTKFIGLLSAKDATKAYYEELRTYVTLQFYEKPLRNFDKKKK
nr:CBS domain-containing protein [Desulfobulbaceae bacterium]